MIDLTHETIEKIFQKQIQDLTRDSFELQHSEWWLL